MIINIKVPRERRCFATFDSYSGGVAMSFTNKKGDISVSVDFNESQWRKFNMEVQGIKFIRRHSGHC